MLWVTIQFRFKAPSFAAESSWAHVGFLYMESFIEPFGTLSFIDVLPVFFVVTKATRRAPPLAIWFAAAALGMDSRGYRLKAHVIDEFCTLLVIVISGFVFAAYVSRCPIERGRDRRSAWPDWHCGCWSMAAWYIRTSANGG